ncbi:MAG: 30S ribosomal protein S1 [Thiotrichales bacterium]|jgi:small subunit ribosomal protein S1|nr:30S ribosomal protein S1 [Thiotrichales bacterium]MBT3614004.1 30S ribosomal protein S1 [Thiotrichales bacterium]MBT3752075.1 30S ribosomal protein S1 [Thiotrichales bacterium]MBT3836789.1 30S ribosomal protein S1 [Thiotrichales bacterium]MBT4151563.1 30S ribosomal protein S1 [Thiotrichales bacterium]
MSENFAELLEESFKSTVMESGEMVSGTVIDITDEVVLINAGLKTEAAIATDQFMNRDGELEVAIGDIVEVELESVADGYGETILSREKAKLQEAWKRLEVAQEANETIIGVISGKVRGGFTVDLDDVRAFLPGSLVDVRPVRDTSYLEGKDLEFKVIKIDQKRNNVVVSRRAVVEAEYSAEREELLKTLEDGMQVKGIVKNLTDYGAFIDLGGIDGLLHITDMAWKRVRHPSEIVTVGDEIDVQVLRYDREKSRVSLGLKQLAEDPWMNIERRYPASTRVFGKVTNIADYGCFIEIEDGVEGLVHTSEMDWTNKNVHPSKIVALGDEVEIMVLDIDEERRRISLGMKQCKANPWELFTVSHKKGDRLTGNIKSITEFGIFIGLDGDIDGLVHLSDISWNESGEEVIKGFTKGDEVETVVLAIDADRERISLGIKQLEQNPFSTYVAENPRGTIVTGTIGEVDARGAVIQLTEDVTGYLRVAEISQERVEDARTNLTQGEEIEVAILGVDRKSNTLNLSVKQKDSLDEEKAIKEYNDANAVDEKSGSTTIGDLIKEQMGS